MTDLRGLISGSAAGVAIRGLSALAQLASSAVVAGRVGVSGFGLFAAWLAVSQIAGALGRIGANSIVVRILGDVTNSSRSKVLEKFNLRRRRSALLVSGIVGFTAILGGVSPVIAAALAVASFSSSELVSSAAIQQGLKRLRVSQLCFPLLPNGIFLVVLVIFRPNDVVLSFLYWSISIALSALLAMIIADRLVERSLSADDPAVPPDPEGFLLPAWRESSHLTAVEIATVGSVWLPSAVLPVVAGGTTAGLYSAASRAIRPVQMVAAAVTHSVAPRLAERASDNSSAASKAATEASIVSLLATTPFIAVGLIWPKVVLSLFGDGFAEGAGALQILVVGYAIAAATGPVTAILSLGGMASKASVAAFLGFATIVVGIGFAMTAWQAATVVAVAIVVRNVTAAVAVKRHTGFWTIGGIGALFKRA